MLKETKKNREKCSYLEGNRLWVELEGEMRETPNSFYDLRRSGGRNPSSQNLKFIYSTKTKRGYRQHANSPKISCLEKKS